MTRPEIYRALAEGKTVQFKGNSSDTWTNYPELDLLECLHFDLDTGVFNASNYRLAPVPPGDLTYEEARELAHTGVAIEYTWKNIQEGWGDPIWSGDEWDDSYQIENRKQFAYRRKPSTTPTIVPVAPKHEYASEFRQAWDETSDKPAPKMVPLEWTDIRPTDVFRQRGEVGWQIPQKVRKDGIWFVSDVTRTLMYWSFPCLASEYERSPDGGKTWWRCEKGAP